MYINLHSFNCRGLQDYTKRRKIFHYMRSLQSDIIFLQETHCDVNDEKLWRSQWGEYAYFASFTSNSRGLAILIRNSVSMKIKSVIKDPNGRFLILDVLLNCDHIPLSITLANVYAPNNDDPEFLNEVISEVDVIDNPFLIIGGDFNAVISSLDYQGSKQMHANIKARDTLTFWMEVYGLYDVWRLFHPNIRKYTRHQKSPKALSRLDFFLVSGSLLELCNKTQILPGIQSDHSVVSLRFDCKSPQKGKGYWKLNTFYLTDPEFTKLVKDEINNFKITHRDSGSNPNIIWDTFKCYITGICIEYSSRKKRERTLEKDRLIADIDKVKSKLSLNSSSDTDKTLFSRLEELEDKLNKIYDFETKGLIIRSRVRWLEDGEKSSKYFCNLENRAWQRKTIFKLQDEELVNDDKLILNPMSIMKKIQEFYSKLYSIPDNLPSNWDENAANIDIFNNIHIPKLSDDDKQFLERPLSKNELYEVVKSMQSNKTPGFDGLPIEFYSAFWPELNELLIDSFNFSLQSGLMSASQRNGIITLLPKKDRDPLLIKNYRPITLLTTDYKILAKCLTTRLKRSLKYLIHNDQTGFMKGRNISDNIRFILDIIEYTDFTETSGSILLLDIEKAFDSVSHDFLFQTLKHFNFGQNFIDSIKALYNSRYSYVMNNGHLTERIALERGIFQGCPISPYLFLLVIEIMALSIRQNDQIKGISFNNYEAKISLFADDSVCFLDGSIRSFSQLFKFLSKFGEFSGCKINFNKTEAIWVGSKKKMPRHALF